MRKQNKHSSHCIVSLYWTMWLSNITLGMLKRLKMINAHTHTHTQTHKNNKYTKNHQKKKKNAGDWASDLCTWQEAAGFSKLSGVWSPFARYNSWSDQKTKFGKQPVF